MLTIEKNYKTDHRQLENILSLDKHCFSSSALSKKRKLQLLKKNIHYYKSFSDKIL